MVKGAQDHDKRCFEKGIHMGSQLCGDCAAYGDLHLCFELVAINSFLCYYLWSNPGLITNMDDVLRYADIIFSPDEMAMLGGIIGFWFGSRNWSKK
jgi:hypothetical protein